MRVSSLCESTKCECESICVICESSCESNTNVVQVFCSNLLLNSARLGKNLGRNLGKNQLLQVFIKLNVFVPNTKDVQIKKKVKENIFDNIYGKETWLASPLMRVESPSSLQNSLASLRVCESEPDSVPSLEQTK